MPVGKPLGNWRHPLHHNDYAGRPPVLFGIRSVSAGYDFHSPTDIVIEPNKSALVWTNVKATFNENEVLLLFVRSKMGKSHIQLANGTGVIESDYYSNPSNDGNLGFRLINLGSEPYVIKKRRQNWTRCFYLFLNCR